MEIKKIRQLQNLLEEASEALEEEANKALAEGKISRARAYIAKEDLLDRAGYVVGYIKGE